jgi:hypothetical protein
MVDHAWGATRRSPGGVVGATLVGLRTLLGPPAGDGGLGGARRGCDARCRGGVTDDGRGEK